MKNNISFKTAYCLACILLLATACSDYLEHTPDQRTELDTPAKVAELVASAYPKANYVTFLEAMSDNSEDKNIPSSNIVNREPWFFNDIPDRGVDTPDFYWLAAYNAIASANHALEAIYAASDETPYSASKGEALVARAYAHFMLVTIFARPYDAASAGSDPGIPYVKDTEKVVTRKYERGTVAQVYAQIEQDLTEGIPLLNNTSYKEGSARYHFTTTAAHAFATRFYLFKRDYSKVVEHANLAFPGGVLKSSLRAINSPEYRGLEPLAKLAEYTKGDTPANLLLVEAPSLWARNLRGYRYGFTYHLLSTLVWDANVSTGFWGYSFYGTETSLFAPKFREHFVKTDPNANFGIPYNMIPLFSAEEVLFNRAEAYTRMQRYDDALNDLNDFASMRMMVNDSDAPYYDPIEHAITRKRVMNFYKTVDIETGIINTILDFKRVEFMWEGIRWFDIVRHRLPVVHTSFDRKHILTLGPNDPRRVIQIPQEAQMSGLELNPR